MYSYDVEDGKIIAVALNGKSVRAGFMRGLKKAQTADFWRLYPEDGVKHLRQNPFSGVEVYLLPFEASVYDFCLNWYASYTRGANILPVQTYDDMKYLLLEMNPDAYYALLD